MKAKELATVSKDADFVDALPAGVWNCSDEKT